MTGSNSNLSAPRLRLAKALMAVAVSWAATEASAQQAAQGATADSRAQASGAVEEVVVTARRRAESLQDVPITVSVIGRSELEAKAVGDLKALDGFFPNVNVQAATTSASSTQIFLRGIGIDNTGFNVDPAVAVYVDDIYVGRLIGSLVGAGEVEQIEVLSGPQGTLYGRNATAGAVKYVTRKPNLSATQGELSATFGNEKRADFKGSFNLPLITDKLGLLVSAQRRDQDGYIKLFDATGANTGLLGNGVGITDLRAALRYVPTNNLTVDLATDYTANRSGIQSLTPTNCAALPLQPGLNSLGQPALISAGQFTRCPLFYSDPYASFVGPFPASDPRTYSAGAALTVAWNLGYGTLKSISGYRGFKDVFASALFSKPPPAVQVNLRDDLRQRQAQQEFQFIVSNNRVFNYTVGAIYFHENIRAHYSSQIGSLATIPYHNEDSQISDSYALYGEIYIKPIDKLEFTLGGRSSWDHRSVDRALLRTPYLVPTGTFAGSINSTDFSPKVAVSYQTDPGLLYASYTKGYRPPGYVNTSPNVVADLGTQFQKETETSYEVGFKATLFDRRLTWDTALFQAKYENLEATLTVSGNTIVVVSNTKIKGIESSLTYRPMTGLSLFANVGILSNEYTRPPLGQPYAVKLKHAPPQNYLVGGNYDWPVSGLHGSLFFGADLQRTGAAFRNVANTVDNASDPYTLVTARFGYRSENDRWSITAGGTNLLDEKYWMLGTQNQTRAYQPPHRVYVKLTAHF